MKRKLLTVFMSSMLLIMALVGCSKKEEVVEPEAETSDIVTQEATMEETTEEVSDVIEDMTEEETLVEEEKEFTKEVAVEKIDRCMEAYELMAKSEDEVTWCILDRCERIQPVGHIEPLTKDGISLNVEEGTEDEHRGTASTAVGLNFIYDYVNNGVEFYDFTEYIESHTKDEIILKLYTEEEIEKEDKGLVSSNDEIMMEAAGLLKYMTTLDNIAYGDLSENVEEFKIKMIGGIETAYMLPISATPDEEPEMFAMYDKDGNLLNICTFSGFDKYMLTFE